MARQLEEINSSGELISVKKGGAGAEKELTTKEYVDAADDLKQDAGDLTADVKAIMESGDLDYILLNQGADDPTPSDDRAVPNVADFIRVQMMKWQNVWAVGDYKWLDVVRDGDWTMIANKDTSERPAPQPVGDKVTDITVMPTYVAQSYLGVVHSGTRYQFTKNGWISKIEAYVPELTGDTNYRFVLVDQTDPLNPVATTIEGAILVENGWASIAVTNALVVTGADLYIYCDALNSGSSSLVTGGWTYGGSTQNIVIPAAGNWVVDNANTTLRVDKTDLDTTDRSTELLGMIPGTSVQFTSTLSPTNNIVYVVEAQPVDGGSYVEYQVSLVSTVGNIPATTDTTMTAEIPVVQATKYVEDTGYWTANPCSFADVEGYLTLDGAPQGVGPNLYGIRLTFQEASVSADWDLVAYSGTSGGGGGGGGSLIYNFNKATSVTITALDSDPDWTDVATVTVNQAPPGVYEYKMSLTYTLDSITTSAFVRFSTDGGSTWNNFQAEPKDITDNRAIYYAYPIEYTVVTDLSLIVQAAKETAPDTMVVTFADAIIDQKS